MNPPPPTPPVESATAPGKILGRKIIWSVIAVVLPPPPILLVGYIVYLQPRSNFIFNLAWLAQHPGVTVAAGLVSAGLAWVGIWRHWYLRTRWLWRLGLTAALGLGFCGLAIHSLEHVQRASADKSALGSLRQIESAADQFYLENPFRLFLDYEELIGPDRYVQSTYSAEGEDLHEIFPIRPDQLDSGYWTLTLPDDRKIGLNRKDVPQPDGVEIIKLPDGRRLETTYRNGVADGPFHAYHADGKIWSDATYVHGRLAGPRWLYLPDGSRFDEAKAGGALKHGALGQLKYQERDIPTAIAEFSQAIALNPSSSDYFFQRGDAHVLNGDLPAALADYTRSLELSPYYLTHYQRGRVRRMLNDAPGAAADFRAAYKPDRYSAAMFWLYLTEWAQGRQEQVTAEMTTAVEKMMHDPEDQQIGKFLLGQITETQLLETTQRARHGDIYMVQFYIAMRALLAGDQPGAMERYRRFLQLPVPAHHDHGKVIEIGDGHWFEREEARRALQVGNVTTRR